MLDANEPFSFVFDLETGGFDRFNPLPAAGEDSYAEFLKASQGDYKKSAYYLSGIHHKTGKPYQLLEFSGVSFYHHLFDENTWKGFHKGGYGSVFIQPQEGFQVSDFSRDEGIIARARERGFIDEKGQPLTEEGFGHKFYESLNARIQEHGPVKMTAWNGVYDLSFLESLTHRYESLAKYQQFFAKKAASKEFIYEAGEDLLHQVTFRYGQQNPDFARQFFRQRKTGQVAQKWQDLRQVEYWKLENVAEAFGGWNRFVPEHLQAHEAAADTAVTFGVTEDLRDALHNLKAGEGDPAWSFEELAEPMLRRSKTRSIDELMLRLLRGKTSERLGAQESRGQALLQKASQAAERTAKSAWGKLLSSEAEEAAVRAASAFSKSRYFPLAAGGLFVGAAVISGWLARGKRRDRQTQIEGLNEQGVMAARRKEFTDFGSGYQGLDETRQQHRYYKNVLLGGAGLLGFSFKGYLMGKMLARKDYAERYYRFLKEAEQRSPKRILATFGLASGASQRIGGTLTATAGDIFAYRGLNVYGEKESVLTNFGAHLQRLMGKRFDLNTIAGDDPALKITFERSTPGSTYRRMFIGGERTNELVSFAEPSRLASSSQRYKNPDYQRIKGLESEGREFFPVAAKTEGKEIASRIANFQRQSFLYADRLNRAVAEVPYLGKKLALGAHEYNTTTGLLMKLQLKRVLPIALGVTALGYADYLTGHIGRNFLLNSYAKVRIAHAELTDKIPGARKVTDWYAGHVPGPWYAPLALPASGYIAGYLAHSAKVAAGLDVSKSLIAHSKFFKDTWSKKGFLIGAALALPFLPGLFGSRKRADELRDIYSGDEPIPVRSGRWWEFGTNSAAGGRIVAYRPHMIALIKSGAQNASVYGSDKERWSHSAILHPLRYFKDPYRLEREHYADRPYPITSPAFSNVPIIGPLLAATVGKLIKPPRLMHEEDWNQKDYTLFSKRVEPRGPDALPPSKPKPEFGLGYVWNRAVEEVSEAVGLPGFFLHATAKKFQDPTAPDDVNLQGSRQMTNLSRRYYELELGAGSMFDEHGNLVGASEGLRRFIQPEKKPVPDANEIANQFAHVDFLPGDDYMIDFKKGDAFTKIPMGYARLPGKGYEALHPELEGVDPNDYPDMTKLRILGDIAPYSKEYRRMSSKVSREIGDDTEQRIEYEKISRRAEEIRESSIKFARRHTGETESIEGTVAAVSDQGVQLKEYPGQVFSFSGIDTSAAALAARSLGNSNREIAAQVDAKTRDRDTFFSQSMKEGTRVKLVLEKGGSQSTNPSAVVYAGGDNINRELLDRGLGALDDQRGGPEMQYLDNAAGRTFRKYTEAVSFSGNQAWYNPLRYIPRFAHEKLWQQHDALEEYRDLEIYGTRERSWAKPVHHFLKPWFNRTVNRLTGEVPQTKESEERQDLATLADDLQYLRAVYGMARNPEERGKYALQAAATNIGSSLDGSPQQAANTLSSHEKRYFKEFLRVKDPEQRAQILQTVSDQLAAALIGQWGADHRRLAEARGEDIPEAAPRTDKQRAADIADFFSRKGLRLPGPDDAIMSDDIDYEDVKAKIIQWEGRDFHDFNINPDRTALLWRKPYLDGAVRELTSGEDRSPSEMASQIDRAITASRKGEHSPRIRNTRGHGRGHTNQVKINVAIQPDQDLRDEIRRNAGYYQ